MVCKKNIQECIREMFNLTNIKMLLILLPFFLPGGLGYVFEIENINIIFHVLKIISIVFYIFTEKFLVRVYSYKKELLLVFIYGVAISFSNLYHSHDILALRTCVFFPFFMLICINYLTVNRKGFINVILLIFGVYNICQIITIIKFFPNGLNDYTGYFWEDTLAGAQYFFGGKNQAVYFILVFLYLAAIKKKQKFNIFIYIYSAIFIMESVKLDSANTMVSIVLFCGFYVLATSGVFEKTVFLFNPYIYIFISVIFFITCVFSNGGQIGIISNILELLGRDPTFTNRTYIWEATTKFFLSSPIIGNGEITFHVLTAEQVHAHNMYLDILFKYGVVAFIPYFLLIIIIGKHLKNMEINKQVSLSVGFMFIMLLHNCFDAMDNYIFILMVCLFITLENSKSKNLKLL